MKNENITFISYYFYPYKEVGAKRVTYWANNLYKYSNYDVTVYTSTIQKSFVDSSKNNNLKIVRIKAPFNNPLIWALKIIPILIKSFYTRKSIYILSGGPFGFFYLTYLIKLFGSKVILDFRDPFAKNPLHNVSFYKRILKTLYEYLVCLPADKIITVNRYCGKIICASQNKISYIDNGYDDTQIKKIKNTAVELKTIGYAGKLSIGRNLNLFLEKLQKSRYYKNYKVKYIGNDYKKICNKYKYMVENFGFKDYLSTLKILNKCEITLLLYGGEKFESSTKIFDYMGLKKPIIAFANKKKGIGQVDRILKNYPHTFYLSKKINFNISKVNAKKFSRKNGLKSLLKILYEFKDLND